MVNIYSYLQNSKFFLRSVFHCSHPFGHSSKAAPVEYSIPKWIRATARENSSPAHPASSSINSETRLTSHFTFLCHFCHAGIVCRRTPGVIPMGTVSPGPRKTPAKMSLLLLLPSFHRIPPAKLLMKLLKVLIKHWHAWQQNRAADNSMSQHMSMPSTFPEHQTRNKRISWGKHFERGSNSEAIPVWVSEISTISEKKHWKMWLHPWKTWAHSSSTANWSSARNLTSSKSQTVHLMWSIQ